MKQARSLDMFFSRIFPLIIFISWGVWAYAADSSQTAKVVGPDLEETEHSEYSEQEIEALNKSALT